jgi:hypothetical protein
MAVYLVLDNERPMGRVVAPTGEAALGLGAGTVLLQRRGRGLVRKAAP